MSGEHTTTGERFGGIQRLYGGATERLTRAHVVVVGMGGVGSWVAEALARSAIGTLTLVDGDEVCVTNTNRQLVGLTGAVGRLKVEVMAERLRDINPEIRVVTVPDFVTLENAGDLVMSAGISFVVDAVDGVTAKAALIGRCTQLGVPVITCGGSGARIDPSQVRTVDLADTHSDRLLFYVRRVLRRHYGFSDKGPMGVPCVFTAEPPIFPDADCVSPGPSEDANTFAADGTRLDCSGGFGAASFVTGVVGFTMAAHVVNAIAKKGDGSARGPVPIHRA